MREALITAGVIAGIVVVLLVGGRIVARRVPEQLGDLVRQLIPVLAIGTVVVGLLVIIDPDQADSLLQSAVQSVPRVMIAVIVVMIARALGRILGLFSETALRRVSPVIAARSRLILSSAVLGIGVIIALQQLGISTDIILILIASLAFGTALGTALAFGIGSVPVARQVAAGRHVANRYQPGDRVAVGGAEGTIESIGLATTRLIVPGAPAADVPNEEFLRAAVMVTPGG